ncbi:MAG: hypothetical protein QM500_15960 [Methylococcales bacterium]
MNLYYIQFIMICGLLVWASQYDWEPVLVDGEIRPLIHIMFAFVITIIITVNMQPMELVKIFILCQIFVHADRKFMYFHQCTGQLLCHRV